MQVTFHFEPDCPWTWMTSRWLLRAAELEDLEVRWAPFSLFHIGGKHPEQAAHRVVQHLVVRGDHAAVGRFYAELGERVHKGRQELTPAVTDEAARAAGLDDAAIAAAGDESLDAGVAAATDRAFEGAGPDVGSPILHWVDGDDEHEVWVFGPLLDCVPEPPCAAELWRGVRYLAVHPMFKELKRGRAHGPNLSTT